MIGLPCAYLMRNNRAAFGHVVAPPTRGLELENGAEAGANYGSTSIVTALQWTTVYVIASEIPDVAPGSTPIAFGNWKRVFLI
jgi:hypothetical protein